MLEKLLKVMKEEKIEHFITAAHPNLVYLTGYTGSNGLFYISEHKRIFITDFRYKEQSKEEVKNDIEIIISSAGKTLLETLFEHEKTLTTGTVGIETHRLSADFYLSLEKRIKHIKPVKIVEKLRMVKTPDEVEKIKKAIEITESVFHEIIPLLREGVKEREIASEIIYRMRKKGAEKESFAPIVAFGKNTAKPHAKPGNDTLKKGDFITMDFGCFFKGYASDFTRTVVLGKASQEQKKIYSTVKQAQEIVFNKAHAGMKGIEIDALARNYITKEGFDSEKYFGHSLGHGVGIEIHEMPYFAIKWQEPIPENSTVTVEPGIYIPDIGGVRIEDIVLVKNDHVIKLNKETNNLIEL